MSNNIKKSSTDKQAKDIKSHEANAPAITTPEIQNDKSPSPKSHEPLSNATNVGKQPQQHQVTKKASKGSTAQQPISWGRSNYCKYENIKQPMLDLLLEGKHTLSEIAQELGVAANSTFFKYKALLQNETGLALITLDEKMYLKNRPSSGSNNY